MDGPCSVICGDSSYADVVLPSGEKGSSGIVYDPAAAENSNNSVNRIMLNAGVPLSFVLSIIVDNCDQKYSSVNKIDARGEHEGKSIEPNSVPGQPLFPTIANFSTQYSPLNLSFPTEPGEDAFNGVPDLYQFRYDAFVADDYIKIRFNGGETGYFSFFSFLFVASFHLLLFFSTKTGASFGGLLFD